MAEVDVNLQHTVRFLRAITRSVPANSYVSIFAFVGGKARFEFIPTEDIIAQAERISVLAKHDKADVYARMTVLDHIPEHGRGKKSDSKGACVLWVDLDVEHAQQSKEVAALMLETWSMPPSIVNDSGHGLHAYWLLDEFCTDLERIADCNAWLQQQFAAYGADSVHDVTRIMRIPGTINWKRPDEPRNVELIFCDESRVYSLDKFERASAFMDDEEPPLETLDPVDLPRDFLSQMERISHKLRDRIFSEQTAINAGAEMKATGSVDRSTNDWYIVSVMYDRGRSRQELVAVLKHPTWFSGSKFREKQDHSYVLRTVSKAIAYRKRVTHHQIFVDGRFVPVRLAEALMEIDDYLNVEGTGLHVYESGVFRNKGEANARHQIIGALGDNWTVRHRDQTLAYLKDKTQVGALALQAQTTPLVNLKNGMLDIDTGKLFPHGAGYKSLAQFPLLYDPKATCPMIDEDLATLLDPSCIPVMWEAIGYCLMKGHPYKIMVLLYGPKDTGKSQLLNLVEAFVGKDNCTSIDITKLANHEQYRALLYNKIACICADISDHVEVVGNNELKRLVGDDEVSGKNVYEKPFVFRNPAKLWFGTNQFPSISSPDEALFGRFLIFPFRHVFVRGGDAIPEYADVLARNPREMSGMLNKALEGARRLKAQGGFTKAASMLELGREFRKSADQVIAFWQARTSPQAGAFAKKSSYYTAYRWWAQETGHKVMSDTMFYRRTRELSEDLGISTTYKRVTDDNGVRGQIECYSGRVLLSSQHIEKEDAS